MKKINRASKTKVLGRCRLAGFFFSSADRITWAYMYDGEGLAARPAVLSHLIPAHQCPGVLHHR